jgi:hypothetical protein
LKIFVVFGTTGEYSDRTEWMVRAYADEAEAQRIVEEYTKQSKACEARTKLPKDDPQYLNRYTWLGPKWPHDDPTFSMDYTGTDYFYGEVELVG